MAKVLAKSPFPIPDFGEKSFSIQDLSRFNQIDSVYLFITWVSLFVFLQTLSCFITDLSFTGMYTTIPWTPLGRIHFIRWPILKHVTPACAAKRKDNFQDYLRPNIDVLRRLYWRV